MFVFHNDWLKNHCWLSVKIMMLNFVVVVNVLMPMCRNIGVGMPNMHIFVEEIVGRIIRCND